MTDKTKRILITIAIVTFTVALVVLGPLSYKTESLVIDVIQYIAMKSPLVLLAVVILHGWMKKEIPDKCGFVTAVCGAVIALDLVAVGTARLIVTGESTTVLFLPVAAPLCCMVMIPHILGASKAVSAEDKKKGCRVANIILYPLLALAIYSEIISFM